jgi:hypothetical protein
MYFFYNLIDHEYVFTNKTNKHLFDVCCSVSERVTYYDTYLLTELSPS